VDIDGCQPFCTLDTQCKDTDNCTTDYCINPGRSSNYGGACGHTAITTCTNNDKCCLSTCFAENDNDCNILMPQPNNIAYISGIDYDYSEMSGQGAPSSLYPDFPDTSVYSPNYYNHGKQITDGQVRMQVYEGTRIAADVGAIPSTSRQFTVLFGQRGYASGGYHDHAYFSTSKQISKVRVWVGGGNANLHAPSLITISISNPTGDECQSWSGSFSNITAIPDQEGWVEIPLNGASVRCLGIHVKSSSYPAGGALLTIGEIQIISV